MQPQEPPASHHRLICDAIDRILSGESSRIILMMPPGAAKSTYASVLAPTYILGRRPECRVITASYSDGLATQFGRKVRNLLKSPEFRELFPTELSEDTQAKDEWETKEGGGYKSTSVNGSVTGFRGDVLIGDDLIKGRAEADSELIRNKTWDWWINDFRITRGRPGYAVLLIGTRWHEDDPIGRTLPADWNGESGPITDRNGEVWDVICVPAVAVEGLKDPLGRAPGEYLWPEWFTPVHWEMTRKALAHSPRTWNSLYQQVPSVEDGDYFRREWFTRTRYTSAPKELVVYMSGDFAVTPDAGDFTEIAVWGVDQFENVYVLDWWFGQTDPETWVDEILDRVARWRPVRFLGEQGVIKRAIEPWLRRRMRERNIYVADEWLPTSSGNKAARAQPFQAIQAQGRVFWPHNEWAERAINQLLKFPSGRYDDVVDTCGLFGQWIGRTFRAYVPAPPKPVNLAPPLTMGDVFGTNSWDAR